jgi:DNA-directed RNA polymerase subunit M/transcription elongation factor TFIIS
MSTVSEQSETMHATRAYVVKQFAEILNLSEEDVTIVNLEKNILNHAVERVAEDAASFENEYFRTLYKCKFLSVKNTLLKNDGLKAKIQNKVIKSSDVINLKPWEALPDGPYAAALDDRMHKELRKEWFANEQRNQVGFFKCRCGSNKTTYQQAQTRSADEPMTTFVSCMTCGKNFKC